MLTIATLAFAVVFVAVFKKAIRRIPWAFYIAAFALDMLVFASPVLDIPRWLGETVVLANVRCLFAFGLLLVVMFTGVLRNGSALKAWLSPIRAELSIIAAILTVGHIARYAGMYSLRALQNPASMGNGLMVSFAVSLLLVILLAVLTVTSFGAVKRRMGALRWKALQRLSYVFYGLVYVHVLLIMMRSALAGGLNAQISIMTYGAILVVYAVLRIRRWRLDRVNR